MTVRTTLVCGLMVLGVSCGPADEESNNTMNTNNAETNNGMSNTTGTNNSIPPQDDWEATVMGGAEELSTMGPKLDILIEGSTWAFSSNAVDGGQLAFNINGGDELMMVPYRVSLFQIEFPEQDIECEALADLRITVEDVDPPAGTFAGGVACESTDGSVMFEGTTEGSWEANSPD